jgi:lipopolysaccharide transport system ATP-binding protein
MKPIIEVTNLSKKYILGEIQPYYSLRDTISDIFNRPFRKTNLKKGEFWALNNISFDASPGEVLGVIGRNGAGKSTLLKILSRITPPTRGGITLRGRIASLLEVGTGFHPELTGRENVFLNGAILGMTRKEILSKFDEIVTFSEIDKFIDTPVKHYSSGMYMRLAFAVAAHLEPEILLIDEVLAVGDTQFQKKCLGKMQDISNEKGRTIIFVSHNLSAISSLCSKTILLDKGVIKSIGKTEKVIREYTSLIKSISSAEIAKRKDRRGSGKAHFTKIVIKNREGLETKTLVSGESISIEISYKVFDKSFKYFDFSMSIDTLADQYRLTSITNKVFNKPLASNKEVVKININRLSLAPGRYSFNLIMVDRSGEIVDWLTQAGNFEVVDGNFYHGNMSQGFVEGNLLLDFKISD